MEPRICHSESFISFIVFFDSKKLTLQASVTEDAAWGYLMQLAAALRAVHSMGLACRVALTPSKVLLLPGSRLRLGMLHPFDTKKRYNAASMQVSVDCLAMLLSLTLAYREHVQSGDSDITGLA